MKGTKCGEQSRELAPLRSLSEARGRLFGVWLGSSVVPAQVKGRHSTSQDRGAAGRFLRRWKMDQESGATERVREGREQGEVHSTQLLLICGLVLRVKERSGGRRKADLGYPINRKEVKEPCPF